MTFTRESELHVVLGAGQVGPALARELVRLGHRVRVVRRGAPLAATPGVEWLRGDLTEPTFAEAACRGATVVYNCTNPELYHKWDQLLFPLAQGILKGAMRANAKLVVLDNLYMLGAPDQVPFNENTPMNPRSKKGQLRKQLVEQYLQAHARGDIQWTSGRAADFFGPGAAGMSAWGDRLVQHIAKRTPIEVFGNPELPRSYSFIPDVARGLATLRTRDESWGNVWHLPVAWKGNTLELIQAIAQELGEPVRTRRLPDIALAVAGVFSPLIGAFREMTYQWKVPFVVDDRRFCTTFGVEATPAQVAVQEAAKALEPKIRAFRTGNTRDVVPSTLVA